MSNSIETGEMSVKSETGCFEFRTLQSLDRRKRDGSLTPHPCGVQRFRKLFHRRRCVHDDAGLLKTTGSPATC
jgi:hypothetical protein